MFLFFLKVNMTASKCAEYMEMGGGILISSCTPALHLPFTISLRLSWTEQFPSDALMQWALQHVLHAMLIWRSVLAHLPSSSWKSHWNLWCSDVHSSVGFHSGTDLFSSVLLYCYFNGIWRGWGGKRSEVEKVCFLHMGLLKSGALKKTLSNTSSRSMNWYNQSNLIICIQNLKNVHLLESSCLSSNKL